MIKNINQVIHNLKFLNYLEVSCPNQYADWKITVAFYIAVHYIDAYYISRNIKIRSHENRNKEMNSGNFPFVYDIYSEYGFLYGSSRASRYNGYLDEDWYFSNLNHVYKDCKISLRLIREFVMKDLEQDEGYESIQMAETEAYSFLSA